MAALPQPARAAAMVLVLCAVACRGPRPGEPEPEPVEPGPNGAVATGSAVMSAEDVRGVRATRAEELLEGRFAGVQLLRMPNGGISVRIRGQTSVNAGGEPLFVLDGMPVEAEPGGALKWLDPHDIARIEVLKDPAQTSFYGVRGANGVVLITTKSR